MFNGSGKRLLWLLPAFAVAAVGISAGRQGQVAEKLQLRMHPACARGFVEDGDGAECVPIKHPESFIEVIGRQGEMLKRKSAPFNEVHEGAEDNAHNQRDQLPTFAATWQPVGPAVLNADSQDYEPHYLGWQKLSGRVTSFAAGGGAWYLSSSDGGVWKSTDSGASWTSIGDKLRTQVVGAIAYSPVRGGTIVAGTGDNAMAGGLSISGLGVYVTSAANPGNWRRSSGVPNGALTFKIAVDPGNSTGATVYAATSKGLFRSTDGGLSFANVNLPVPGCAGNITSLDCFWANVVTDVVVRTPDANGIGAGQVMAAVGWIAGQRVEPRNGVVQAPQNGIYVSASGRPGTFAFVDPGASVPTRNGFAPTPRVGRVALGSAHGPGQNHDIVYAIVQDAKKLQGCFEVQDTSDCSIGGAAGTADGTYLDGAYVSRDFGRTWTQMMTASELKQAGNGSALIWQSALGYAPGVQSWYNLWIEADPTATDAVTGAPTRLLFGLEEVWENTTFGAPQIGPSNFRVIGRYWNRCALVLEGIECNSASTPLGQGTTTHPDQHAALFVPDATGGGVNLLIGNDGGVWVQHAAAGQDFSNDSWGPGNNDGLRTTLPYDAAMAKDGTVVAGLQDNGEVKFDPATGRWEMIYGGDGFFTAIDPDNSQNIIEEYALGAARITSDGGKNWTLVNPKNTGALFSTPLQLDPSDAKHWITGGKQITETTYGYADHCADPPACTTSDYWTRVYDLGTNTVNGVTANNVTSAVDLNGDSAYVGFCGPCSVFKSGQFGRGIATNVGGATPGKRLTANGWHVAAAKGLPVRYINSVRMDPANPSTIYVTLGGYSNHWVPPGAVGDNTSLVGVGHVFKSTDHGETFTDVSGNLPDTPANWVLQHNGRLVVGTDIGVFISSTLDGGSYSVLGTGFGAAPVAHLGVSPANPSLIVAATSGRGVWTVSLP